MVEENISEEFRLRHIDKQEIEQKKLMSKRYKKVSTTLNYVWKRGRDRAMLLFPNVTNGLEKAIGKVQVNNLTTVNFLK